MKRTRTARIRGEGLVLLFIILAILGGGAWYVYSSRKEAEKNCAIFAQQVAERVIVHQDQKYLHVRLGPAAQIKYLQSWRERLMYQLRQLGTPTQPIEVKGQVHFTSGFFKPHGEFRAEVQYPTTKAYLDLSISSGMTVWQIDEINLTWDPPPTPSPTPIPAATEITTPTPTPTPTAVPEQKPRRKRR